MNLDWDTFYFEYWVVEHGYEEENMPDQQDYFDWLTDRADLALGHE